ncbi:hypothetical protein TYRP_002336 [Tyrophagus putrescentiae]|nr:hypothetical protein TYRP_002336 [Tyrophagus putrescentiae]
MKPTAAGADDLFLLKLPSHSITCHICSGRAVNGLLKLFQVRLLLFLCTLLALLKESQQLRIIKFDVPSSKANGSAATLHCNYDLDEGEELYSVKLYHENEEFYRYLPKESPPAQWYNSPGIYVEGTRSNATHVVLSRTDLNSDGLYACEVSTEAPAFATRKNEKMMKIYVLPQETLTIQGGRDYYRINEHVNFVCISGKGWPLLQLRWFINDAPAPSDFLTTFKAVPDGDGLLRSKLGLNFRATRDYFRADHLRLRCAAALTLLYELKAVEYLIDGTKKHRTNAKRFTNDLAQINSKDVPVISGIRDKYNVNETINLNCSTTASRAELAWYINGHRVNSSYLRTYSRGVSGENSNGKSANDQRPSLTVLGVRLQMEKRFFQTEEIELKCVAAFAKTIADFSGAGHHQDFLWIAGLSSGAQHCLLGCG